MHHKHTHMLTSEILTTDRFTNDATCLPSHARTLSKKTWTPMQRPRRAWARALAKALELSAMFHPIQISSRSMSFTHDVPLGGRSPPKAPNPNPNPNPNLTLTLIPNLF